MQRKSDPFHPRYALSITFVSILTRGQSNGSLDFTPLLRDAQYALPRLRKDRPDLHEQVVNKELSAHAAMKRAGFVVWLTAPAEVIFQRLNEDPTTAGRRPALTTGGIDEVVKQFAVREPQYRAEAELTVEPAHREPEDVANDNLTAK